MSSVSNLTAVRAMISDAPREELQILTKGLCEELELVKSQLGWIIEEEANAEAVAQALRKELDATKAELGATKAELGATKAELGATKAKLDAAEEEGFELETELHDLLQEALADKAAADEAAAEAAAALGKLQKELDACKAELVASKARASAMGAMVVTMKKELSKEAGKNARLRKQSLGLENQIRGAIAVALREAMGLVDPRRRSPRLAEVASKKAAKV
jgi:chromosome segregation ATPase